MTASELVYSRFVLRSDTYARQIPNGDFIRQKGKALTLGVIRQHLAGTYCIGVYPLLDSKCKWGCIDFDATDGNPLGIQEAVKTFVRQARHFGIELLVECSGNKGWHGWLFSENVEAKLIRQVLYGLVREVGPEAFYGCTYPPEVFPKHDATEPEKEFSYLVKLPWGKRADNGQRAQFCDPDSLLVLPQHEQLDLLEAIKIHAETELAGLVSEHRWHDSVLYEKAKRDITLARKPSSTYRGDLPCFEYLHDRKSGAVIAEGHRNLVLFAITNHHKRKGSSQATAEDDLLNLNRSRCRPPDDEDRVLRTVESAYKSDESSACCDIIQAANLCPVYIQGLACPVFQKGEEKREKRREELNSDDTRLTITPLYVMRTDPPIYVVTVKGKALQLTLKELKQFSLFTERCMAEQDFVPELPYIIVEDPNGKKRQKAQSSIWLEMVNEALAARIELASPPEDASPRGAVWSEIKSFLTEGSMGEDRDDLKRGLVVVDTVAGTEYYLFRGEDLRRRFRLLRIDDLPMSQVWKLIHDRGGKNAKVDTKNSGKLRVYMIPVEVLRAEGPGETLPLPELLAPPLGLLQ